MGLTNYLSRKYSSVYSSLPLNILLRKLNKSRGLIFLMYHSVPPEISEYNYATPVRVFKEQMKVLSEYCQFISMGEAYDLLSNGTNNISLQEALTVVLTFDDGYRNNLTEVYPILEKLDIPGTIFLTTNFIDQNNRTFADWDLCRNALEEKIITFGAHTISHCNLKSLNNEDIKDEIMGSKEIIESQLAIEAKYFAFPSGGYTDYAIKLVNENYDLGFADRFIDDQIRKDKINRVSIDKRHNNSIKKFIAEILLAHKYLKDNLFI